LQAGFDCSVDSPLLVALDEEVGFLQGPSSHVHLDHHNCMEILAVRGPIGNVKAMAQQLTATNGVKHGRLTVTSTGKEFVK